MQGLVTPKEEGSNEYIVTYIATVAGFAEVLLAVLGVPLPQLTTNNLLITNGAYDQTKTTFTPTQEAFMSIWGRPNAGRNYPLKIYVFDAFDNPHNSPPLSFRVRSPRSPAPL